MDSKTVKYIVIGSSNTGKSTLSQRYVYSNLSFVKTHPTIGVELYSVNRVCLNGSPSDGGGRRLKIHIWDTAGQEKYQSITFNYYKGAMGAVVAFSLIDIHSFNDIEMYITNIDMYAGQIPIVLAGTFSDMPNHVVTDEEARKVAEKHGIKYFKVSSKTGENVEVMFDNLALQVCNFIDNQERDHEYHIKEYTDMHKLVDDSGGAKHKKRCC
jgi:small GTP-binding protein